MMLAVPEEREIFDIARRIDDAASRAAYLSEACGGAETSLRQRVDALLQVHDEHKSFLASPAVTAELDAPLMFTAPGTVIGRYKLLELIGEGGYGTVFMAEQTAPVQRKVALKIVKAGMDTRQVIARFEAERQALALMDHPNIAKVFDAGVTETGRPYFVMELVKGVPITKYCDEHTLPPKQRLELFVQVCQAVQHAHQKGIIHRDLKPSNVLVAEYDEKPVPKVIDFGVAKAVGQQLTEKTMFTAFGQVVGTIEYMSPEHAKLNQLDVDTRSDVYSLGVILYELLTGQTPFDRHRLQSAAFDEMLRIIREEDPQRPSTRLSALGQTLATVSTQRQTDPKKLSQTIRGELDWIVMKAMEKDRTRRYETASGFAMDVQRYLAGEAVQAVPPSTTYRLKKFIRRNLPQVIAASLVFVALAAGAVGTTLGLVRANRAAEAERVARGDAVEQKRLADEKREEAERNLAFARKGNEILGSVFAGLKPETIAESGRPLQDLLRENLSEAVKELEGSAIGDPLEVAAMQNTLGTSLYALGEAALAVEVHQKALNTRKAMLGPDDDDTLVSMDNLAKSYQADGKLDLALPLFEESLKLTKAKFGDDHPETLTSLNNLAVGYGDAGKLDLALPILEETLELTKAQFGHDHPETLTSMFNLATGYGAARKPDLALPILEESLKLAKASFGPEHPMTLSCMNSLGTCYWTLRQFDKSILLLEELLPLREKTLGRLHPKTLHTVAGLGVAYDDAGRLAEATPLLEEAFQASKKHTNLHWVGTRLLNVYARSGKSASAAKLLDELLDEARQTLPKDSPQLASQLVEFAIVRLDMKEYAAAETLLRECLAIREENEPNAWTTFNTQSMLGGSLLSQKKYKDAEPLLLMGYEGMKVREKAIPPQGASRIPEALDRLIELYTLTDKPEEAKKWRAERANNPNLAPLPPTKEKR